MFDAEAFGDKPDSDPEMFEKIKYIAKAVLDISSLLNNNPRIVYAGLQLAAQTIVVLAPRDTEEGIDGLMEKQNKITRSLLNMLIEAKKSKA